MAPQQSKNMRAWDEIIRLSKGSVKDKINAIQSIFLLLDSFSSEMSKRLWES